MRRPEDYDHWFRRIAWEFQPLLLPYAGKPITYVEVGCWAGASAAWVAKEILTHPDSRGYGVDPYPPDPKHPPEEIEQVKQAARRRVAETGIGDRWQWIVQPSVEFFRYQAVAQQLKIELGGNQRPIDILYIDGDHYAHAVLQDFCAAWPLLHPGSLVIFDDYITKFDLHPGVRQAFDAIIAAWGTMLNQIEPSVRRRRAPKQRAVRIIRMTP